LRLLLYLYARFLISPRTHTLLPNYNFLAILFPQIFFAHNGQEIRLFLLTPVLVIRSEAVCDSAASISKQHSHGNRALNHEFLDEEVMLDWNATLLHLADPFIKSSSNTYFFQLKDKHWIFFRKAEQYRLFKLVSPGSVALNRLRTSRRIPMLYEQNKMLPCVFTYIVSNKIGVWAVKKSSLGENFWKIFSWGRKFLIS
jgi:hypothetical protein